MMEIAKIFAVVVVVIIMMDPKMLFIYTEEPDKVHH